MSEETLFLFQDSEGCSPEERKIKIMSIRHTSSVAENPVRCFMSLIILLGIHLSLSLSTFGQTGTASIRGVVVDPSGARISGATVTITNIETRQSRKSDTDDEGRYLLQNLDRGNYTQKIEAMGFKSQVREGLVLQIDQKMLVDITMELGDVAEKVTITGEPVLVDHLGAETREVIDQQKIVNLPLNGRNFMQLALLAPAITPGSLQDGNSRLAGGVALSVAGQRGFNNNYTLDGVQMTDPRNPHPGIRPSIDSIQEFEVKTSVYSAEYGLRAGGQVNVAIKSGTNQFHGSAFIFHRNDNLNARNLFDPANRPKPEFKFNQFGFTIGGPVFKDRLFFFFAYDGFRVRRINTITATVPLPQWLAGDFSNVSTPILDPLTGQPFTGNIIPTSRLDPRARIIAGFYPSPTRPGVAANLVGSGSNIEDDDQFIVRVDHQLGNKDSYFVRVGSLKKILSGVSLVPVFSSRIERPDQNATLQETHIFSPTTINQFQIGYNRFVWREGAPIPGVTGDLPVLGEQINLPGIDRNPRFFGPPIVSVSGFLGLGGSSNDPFQLLSETWQLKNILSFKTGPHNVKVGGDIQRNRLDQQIPIFPRGGLTFTGEVTGHPVADLVLGFPFSTQRSVGDNTGRLRNTFWHFFVTDDWPVTKNLHITVGLRYELNLPVKDIRGLSRNFNPQTGQLFPAVGEANVPLYNTDKNNFAPRVGIAWRPFGRSDTSVRAGYGIFYSIPEFNAVTLFNLNPPLFSTDRFVTSPTNRLTLENPFPEDLQAGGAGTPGLFALNPLTYRDALTQTWNLTIQHEVLPKILLEVGYIGAKTSNLLWNTSINRARPGPGPLQSRRPYPQFGSILFSDSSAISNYNGLEIKVRRSFSTRLYFISSYTFSKAIDQSHSGIFGDVANGHAPQDPDNLQAEKGRAPFDMRHRWSFAYGYQLPFRFGSGIIDALAGHWQINGIASVESGRPMSVQVPFSTAGTGGEGVTRADRLANGNLPSSQRSVERWFDTGAFAVPQLGTFGNSGRGILDSPGRVNFDFSLFKEFPISKISESFKVQLRAEAFNLFNTPPLGMPGLFIGTPTFGRITSAGPGRELQFGLKVLF